jgi:hypothetical protein
MSLKLFALNFASLATAQVTTSLWFPGVSNSSAPLLGSVVAKNGDKVTLSLDYSNHGSAEVFQEAPATVTVEGTTLFEYQLTYSDSDSAILTIDGKCSRKDESDSPTCQLSTVDYVSFMSDYCKAATSTGPSTYTVTRTWDADSDGPASTRILTETFTNTDTEVPDDCSSINPEEGVQTIDMNSNDDSFQFKTYQLVLTAGTEKLSAGATPTAGASSTGGSASAGSSGQPTGQPTGQSTGAAPMMTAAPVLAGLGAAAAAIFL